MMAHQVLKTKMKGIIYCRVSDPTQVSGTSLESQKEECLRYAKDKGIDIARIFIEKGESATAANRTELLKALDFCKDNKGKIAKFIVWKIDRFARNTTDHYGLQAQLIKYGTSLYSVTEPMISDGPTGKVLEAVLAGFAQFENDTRKMRCEGGMHRKITEGIWPWEPPIGYTRSKKTERRKTKPDEIDPERFNLIQRGLKAYSRGEHTISSLTRAMNEWGLKARSGVPMFKQLVERMLKDKYYAGILVSPWDKHDYQGLHEPMITIEEHRQIQAVKSGLTNNATQPRLISHPDFPLRGFVFCAPCREKLTASWQSGRNGTRYPYYRCNDKKCSFYGITIRKQILEDAFISLLERVTPPEGFVDAFEEVFIEAYNNQKELVKNLGNSNEKERSRLIGLREKYIEMRANDEIDVETLKSLSNRIEVQLAEFGSLPSHHNGLDFDIKIGINQARQYIVNPAKSWLEIKEIKRKQRYQQLVLPEGVTYDRETNSFGTAVLSPVFELSQHFDGDASHLVAGEGFAPPTFGL